MTTTQWMFEYYSLRKKEKEDVDLVVDVMKSFRKMLVNVLGLDLMKDSGNKDENTFMPLSLMVGRREVVDSIIDKIKKEEQIAAALNDKDFDSLSKNMAEDTGDMEPIITIPSEADIIEMNKKERERQLKTLNIKLVDSIPDAPHINTNQKQSSIDYNKTEEPSKKSIKMRFDDNG